MSVTMNVNVNADGKILICPPKPGDTVIKLSNNCCELQPWGCFKVDSMSPKGAVTAADVCQEAWARGESCSGYFMATTCSSQCGERWLICHEYQDLYAMETEFDINFKKMAAEQNDGVDEPDCSWRVCVDWTKDEHGNLNPGTGAEETSTCKSDGATYSGAQSSSHTGCELEGGLVIHVKITHVLPTEENPKEGATIEFS